MENFYIYDEDADLSARYNLNDDGKKLLKELNEVDLISQIVGFGLITMIFALAFMFVNHFYRFDTVMSIVNMIDPKTASEEYPEYVGKMIKDVIAVSKITMYILGTVYFGKSLLYLTLHLFNKELWVRWFMPSRYKNNVKTK